MEQRIIRRRDTVRIARGRGGVQSRQPEKNLKAVRLVK